MAATVTYLGQSAGDSVGSTSEDVTIDLGTAHAGDKIVVILLHANWAGGNNVATSVTIDGQTGVSALTPVQSTSETGSIWYFDDASGVVGGSSTINATFATGEQPQMVAAYRLTGVVTGGPTTNLTQNTTGTTSTLSLNVGNGAVLLAGSMGRHTGDDGATWTGATEDNETTGAAGDYQCSTASLVASSTETPRTLTCVWTASQTRLIGVAATWAAGATAYTLTAAVGSYTLTGIAATLNAGKTLIAEAGSYMLTGIDAVLNSARSMIAAAGAYTLSGQDAILRHGYFLVAAAGSYVLTGLDAILRKGLFLIAETGSYALTGVAAGLNKALHLTAAAGAYVFTGLAAVLVFSKVLTAEAGSYAVTGYAIVLARAISAGQYLKKRVILPRLFRRREIDPRLGD